MHKVTLLSPEQPPYVGMAGIGLLMAELYSLNGTAQAALGLTNVTPTTTIVANGCSVSQASQEQTVDLGNWASKQFATTVETSTAKRFVINLDSCGSAATRVQVMFRRTITTVRFWRSTAPEAQQIRVSPCWIKTAFASPWGKTANGIHSPAVSVAHHGCFTVSMWR
ncbi:fimbrial protein [Lonsdalea quercina]|uniref:fimbrial protein n=1 Tax=Lonsdalea quercina TaxID=71657 RepID=UPI0039750E40